MSRDIIPVAIVLFVLLVAVSGFTATRGLHLQDGMYRIASDDTEVAAIFAGDPRFSVDAGNAGAINARRSLYDAVIIRGNVTGTGTDRSRSAIQSLDRDYQRYKTAMYNQEEDLFAAYPLWIETEYVKSELDFAATSSGQRVARIRPEATLAPPSSPVEPVPAPPADLGVSREELRSELSRAEQQTSQFSRYTDVLGAPQLPGKFKTPSQLSPPLPFDSIILIFVFIFPLYFTSQFYMMSIMNERINRQGEVLLSTPVHPGVIVAGKALPYLAGMFVVSAAVILYLQASLAILLILLPVILFFLANALIIGMLSRSFKELSFISIFFSTIATSYLFFPSIFANVHVVSLVSPLTLIVLTLQETPVTLTDYIFSTSLFYLTSGLLFFIGVTNFREEQLFSQKGLFIKVRDYIGTAISTRHPLASLFAINAVLIPFVFMAQMLLLVLFFNLPMPLSLILLIVMAAYVEEIAKSVGIVTLIHSRPEFRKWPLLIAAALITAAGFLFGEKLLLFVTLSQITESVFGSILFLSLQVLWLPFLLHFAGVTITAVCYRMRGSAGLVLGLGAATLLHCGYNMYFIMGWLS